MVTSDRSDWCDDERNIHSYIKNTTTYPVSHSIGSYLKEIIENESNRAISMQWNEVEYTNYEYEYHTNKVVKEKITSTFNGMKLSANVLYGGGPECAIEKNLVFEDSDELETELEPVACEIDNNENADKTAETKDDIVNIAREEDNNTHANQDLYDMTFTGLVKNKFMYT